MRTVSWVIATAVALAAGAQAEPLTGASDGPTPVLVRPPADVAAGPAPLSDWRPLDAENTLIIDTEHGRMVVELRPEFAPLAVARIKQLARSGFYDGLLFH